jgi:pSer/pThr/pTyr-binding forkhead associated (FHA) protein
VVDLGSTNGTRVNGVRVDQQVLKDGDEVSFGNTRMRFEAS